MKSITSKFGMIAALVVLLGFIEAASAFYDPGAQRWMNRDPAAERAGINLHAFVQNNPLNKLDPVGLAPVPKEAEECFCAHPLYPDDPMCNQYGDQMYMGVKLSCFCKCPLLTDPWSLYVRGCLRCMANKRVNTDDAHQACYKSADQNYTRPTLALADCYLHCKQ